MNRNFFGAVSSLLILLSGCTITINPPGSPASKPSERLKLTVWTGDYYDLDAKKECGFESQFTLDSYLRNGWVKISTKGVNYMYGYHHCVGKEIVLEK